MRKTNPICPPHTQVGPWLGRPYETNPISAVRSSRAPMIPVFHHSNAGVPGGTRGQNAQNKPNFRRNAQPTKRRLCETKPNLGGLGHLGDGAWGSLLYETKPICPRTGRWGRGWRRSCETNPIRSGLGRARSQVDERRETSPICRGQAGTRTGPRGRGDSARANRAKRSQFPPTGGPVWWSIVQNEPNFPRQAGPVPGPIVQNEANFLDSRGRRPDSLCETKPISAGWRCREVGSKKCGFTAMSGVRFGAPGAPAGRNRLGACVQRRSLAVWVGILASLC
jgi:hypothetical protein